MLDREIAAKRTGRMHEIVIEKRELCFRNEIYRADPPLRFRASFDRRGRIYDLRGDFESRFRSSLDPKSRRRWIPRSKCYGPSMRWKIPNG